MKIGTQEKRVESLKSWAIRDDNEGLKVKPDRSAVLAKQWHVKS